MKFEIYSELKRMLISASCDVGMAHSNFAQSSSLLYKSFGKLLFTQLKLIYRLFIDWGLVGGYHVIREYKWFCDTSGWTKWPNVPGSTL